MLFFVKTTTAQLSEIGADLSSIDGVELTTNNVFSYRIINPTGKIENITVVGRFVYKRTGLSFTYKFNTALQPGINELKDLQMNNLNWSFSSPAFKELFQQYQKLPQGTYEYCVSISLSGVASDNPYADKSVSCIYYTVEDLFLISLLTPDNDAKIYEYNPMLSWIVNYPFVSELTYKLRLAEQKEGQGIQQAITRNNPIYKEDNLMVTGQVYPVTARQLVKWQPYVWTVDAYYKGILLGGAEPWKFTIVEDSVLEAVQEASYFVDIRNEQRGTLYNAIGEIRIKYILDDKNEETLHIKLKKDNGDAVKMKKDSFNVVLGDNRLILPIKDEINLKHKANYFLEVTNSAGHVYIVYFKYFNPYFLRSEKL